MVKEVTPLPDDQLKGRIPKEKLLGPSSQKFDDEFFSEIEEMSDPSLYIEIADSVTRRHS